MQHAAAFITAYVTRRNIARALGAVALALALVFAYLAMPDDLVAELRTLPYPLAAAAYSLAIVVATVIAPLAILPMVPTIALILGPWQTAALSVLGWTVGAVIAFILAREYGKPLLRYIVSLESVERYERRFSSATSFWGLVVLRVFVPVDVLSYAIGLVSSMPLWQYTLATLIGVTPFSVIFAYLGHSVTTGEYEVLMANIFVVAALGFLAYRSIRRRRNAQNREVSNTRYDT